MKKIKKVAESVTEDDILLLMLYLEQLKDLGFISGKSGITDDGVEKAIDLYNGGLRLSTEQIIVILSSMIKNVTTKMVDLIYLIQSYGFKKFKDEHQNILDELAKQ